MRTDIHGWIEMKIEGKYVAIRKLHATRRNPTRFSALTGILIGHKEYQDKPLGIPEDISDTAQYHVLKWGKNAHSHSYISLSKACRIFYDTEPSAEIFHSPYNESDTAVYFFDCWEPDLTNVRLVFWFDN